MKNFTLTAFAFCIVLSASAQTTVQRTGFELLSDVPQVHPNQRMDMPMPTMAISDFSERPQLPLEGQSSTDIEHYLSRELVVERQVIGYTQYDLQSNAAIDDRMAGGADAVSAAWTMSLELTPFEDRGTVYNFHDGNIWGEIAYERIESARMGWPFPWVRRNTLINGRPKINPKTKAVKKAPPARKVI